MFQQKEKWNYLTNCMIIWGHDIEGLDNDTEHDYLTCNSGHNGKDYFWYMDEAKSVAIDMDGNIIDESNSDETLEGILYSEDN